MKKSKKPGITMVNVRQLFQDQLDYWESRTRMGDPLFDQWMVDAQDAAKEGLAVMDKFEEAGYHTGKDQIKSALHPFKTADVTWRPLRNREVSYTIMIDNGASISTSATVGFNVEKDLEKTIRKSWIGNAMDDNTQFRIKQEK